MTTTPPPPPPGWYPYPSTGGQRYWDGTAWATLTAPPEGEVKLGKTHLGAAQWGAAIGLLVGLLSGLGYYMSEVPRGQTGVNPGLFLVSWLVVGWFVGLVVFGLVFVAVSYRRGVERERLQVEKAQADAAAQRLREERQQRPEVFGPRNAAAFEAALAAVRHVSESEAARGGWLGELDFTADLRSIAENFRKSHQLRKVADKLSVLDNPSTDDRQILAQAETTVANLETTALTRVDLINRCAHEASLIDDSLRRERAEVRTAEERAQLHAKLSGLLYGIEAAPDVTTADSPAADAVIARVQAYREIKKQIQQVRD